MADTEIITERFDERGDLTIICKAESTDKSRIKYHFLVQSAVLKLASTVWCAMLTGGWAESNKTEIEFHDDDPEALKLILKIIHLKYDDIPTDLAYERFLQLAILSNKYDVVRLIHTFASKWIEVWQKTDPLFYRQRGEEDWMFIAWVFKEERIFRDLAKYLCRNTRVDASNRLIGANGQVLGEGWPDGIVGSISWIRIGAIQEMVEHYDTVHKEIFSGAKTCSYSRSSSRRCHALVVGSFTLSLIRLQWWPDGPGEIILDSPEEFRQALRSINIDALHGVCNLMHSVKLAADLAIDAIEKDDPLDERHYEYFRI